MCPISCKHCGMFILQAYVVENLWQQFGLLIERQCSITPNIAFFGYCTQKIVNNWSFNDGCSTRVVDVIDKCVVYFTRQSIWNKSLTSKMGYLFHMNSITYNIKVLPTPTYGCNFWYFSSMFYSWETLKDMYEH